MTVQNLPPLPGERPPEPPQPAFLAYVLRGVEWVEVGVAFPHADAKGYQLRLDIAPADGELIELRSLDAAHNPQRGGQRPKRNRAPRSRPKYTNT